MQPLKGIHREPDGTWQCLDCLNNGTAEDEADEGITHYAGCPALLVEMREQGK